MENDTVVYTFNNGYKVTEIPEKTEIDSKFGKYISKSILVNNSITYIRHFDLVKGVYPAEAYAEFRDFLEQVSTADEAVASLKKQTEDVSN